MKKLVFLISFFLLLIALNCKEVSAAKKRIRIPQARYIGLTYSTAKLRPDRMGIIVNFLNLGSVKNITYILTYLGNGVDQGVQGTITPSGEATTSRELLFATCSKNICTWHNNLQNMRLTVTTSTKTGSVSTKIYRVKP